MRWAGSRIFGKSRGTTRPIGGIQDGWKLARLLHQGVVRNWRPIPGAVAAWSLEKPLRHAFYRRVFPTVTQRVGKVNRKAVKMLYRNPAKDEGGFSEKEIATLGCGFVYLSSQMAR